MANTRPTLTEAQKKLLLDAQLAYALAGDTGLLIHLGQTELGQTKTEKHIHEASIPLPELSQEQILEMLEERKQTAIDVVATPVEGLLSLSQNVSPLLPTLPKAALKPKPKRRNARTTKTRHPPQRITDDSALREKLGMVTASPNAQSKPTH